MGAFSHRSPVLDNYKNFEGPKGVLLKIEMLHSYEILTT
jgi:hypothetical protein